MGRSGELALTFESSERVASSAEATGGGELFSPLAHTQESLQLFVALYEAGALWAVTDEVPTVLRAQILRTAGPACSLLGVTRPIASKETCRRWARAQRRVLCVRGTCSLVFARDLRARTK